MKRPLRGAWVLTRTGAHAVRTRGWASVGDPVRVPAWRGGDEVRRVVMVASRWAGASIVFVGPAERPGKEESC